MSSYFVKINRGEAVDTFVSANIQTFHVHTVNLSKFHVLGFLHQKFHNNLIENLLEVGAMRAPWSKEFHDNHDIFINKLLKCVVI